MKRYFVLIASIAIMILLGGTYAWSLFATALQTDHGHSATHTQTLFGVMIGVFTVSMLPAGRLMDRWGPRIVAGIGGVLFGGGYLVAGLSGGSFAWLLIGLSFISGVGLGFGYVCPVAICVRWFPKYKGVVTGLAVAGYGGGAILLKHVADNLLHHGMDVLQILRVVGLSYGPAVALLALLLATPTNTGQRAVQHLSRDVLQQRKFWSLAVGMFSAGFAGLAFIGDLKPIGLKLGVGEVMAAGAITWVAVGNAGGRLVWGWIADRLGRHVIPLALLYLAVCLALVPLTDGHGVAFVVMALLVAAGYGASLVIYAAEVADMFGTDSVARIYPMVLLAHGAAAFIGPAAVGLMRDTFGGPVPGLWLSAGIVAAGAVIAGWLGRKKTPTPVSS